MIERTETYYYCEVCGRRFGNSNEALKHEERCFKVLSFDLKDVSIEGNISVCDEDTECLLPYTDGFRYWIFFRKTEEQEKAERLLIEKVLNDISNIFINCSMLSQKWNISHKVEPAENKEKHDENCPF